MVIVAFPWLSIVAPGSRMKVLPYPRSEGVPVIFRVPEMKYTQPGGARLVRREVFGRIACDVEVIIRTWVGGGRVSDERRSSACRKTATGGESGVRSAQRGEGAIESGEGIGDRGRHIDERACYRMMRHPCSRRQPIASRD